MTVKEALDILYEIEYRSYPYSYTEEPGGVIKINNDSHLCLDSDAVDIHTVDKLHFIGNMLDLDSNRSLRSLDGLIFDGKTISLYGTQIDTESDEYIWQVTRKYTDDSNRSN